ncbi:MAG TPA: hypothetical protein GXZ49_06125 [Bacteroidetes bacterium]|jgi:FKBP-type peptidyl-prolyl cis-trans isomerase FkpA|nr:hypothetical protein [Bacteroidota bacterium]
MKYLFHFLIFIVLVSISSCKSGNRTLKDEEREIRDYIASHPEYSFVRKESGLYFADIVVGDGVTPDSNDRVYVRYIGTFVDGTEFDSNMDSAKDFRFYVDKYEVIEGFNESVKYMKEGGTAIIIVPSALGYGNINSHFDPYTPLVFTISIKSVVVI